MVQVIRDFPRNTRAGMRESPQLIERQELVCLREISREASSWVGREQRDVDLSAQPIGGEGDSAAGSLLYSDDEQVAQRLSLKRVSSSLL